MSLYIDKKFVSLLGPKLDKFRQKSDYLWNFRCPICGDSYKNKMKMRGYIYRRKSDLFFTCHNCGTNLSFGNLLKSMDKSLYSEYQLERYKNESHGNVTKPDFSFVQVKPVFNKKPRICLPTVEELPEEHIVKKYVKSRNIPKDKWNQLFFADNFKSFVQEMQPDYDKSLYDEPRLVIPFYDENNNLLGYQGRALVKSKIKYITIKLSEDSKKVFGLNKLDKTGRVYVVEGPIDSLFLKNSIAMMDATLYNAVPSLGSMDYVFIYDNEPRNKDIIKHMNRTIDLGLNICIWPSEVRDRKDINEMILSGLSSEFIQAIIDTHTYNGLRAKLEFENWRKT